ncbi:hypothetical protein [Aeromicrobium massiliense]|uniref:hypothetical protein n=1 Tax=Aeromicrobium massiliense TaxID=1464554 RepID=UPI0002ECFAD2|nr:hypothetical protein [Aeromicrobium massiliense]
MRPLWLVVVRTGGIGRAATVAVCTAFTSGLLLVAVSVLRLGSGSIPERLLAPIADPGTRGGAVLGIVLAALPFLLLLDQSLRLGAGERERRFGALAVGGAAPADLRRWGAIEVGVPAAVGAVGGLLVHGGLRLLLSGPHMGRVGSVVPEQTGPGWWTVPVLLTVAAYGAWAGRRAAARAADSWLVSRGLRRPPRPWGFIPLAGALVLALVSFGGGGRTVTTAALLAAIVLLVVGAASLAPWLVRRSALRALHRPRHPAAVLGLRRIAADPGPAARAGAATGAVALALATVLSLVVDTRSSGDPDVGLVASLVTVGLVAGVALLLVCGSLVVHAVEVLTDRRRSVAAIVAGGVPASVVRRSVRAEALAATLPLAVPGALLGGPVYGWLLAGGGLVELLLVTVGAAAVVALVALAVVLAARLVGPLADAATDPVNLRTA